MTRLVAAAPRGTRTWCMLVTSVFLVASCGCEPGGSTRAAAAGNGGSAGSSGGGQGSQSGEAGSTPSFGGWTSLPPFEVIGPEGLPDCGPGCRIAINRPNAATFYYDHAYDATGVVTTGDKIGGLLYARIGSSETQVLVQDGAEETIVSPHVHGRYVSHLFLHESDTGENLGDVRVLDREARRLRTFYRYNHEQGDSAIDYTAVNDRYVFWTGDTTGLMRADLSTGETKSLGRAIACDQLCTLETGLLCTANGMVFIDQETGERRVLDPNDALQQDGSCSADKSLLAWVDYRDPPGPDSSSRSRTGGEIYLRDLRTGESRRLTFDSPERPIRKGRPNAEQGLVIWQEACPDDEDSPDCDPNPAGPYLHALVRFEPKLGRRCRVRYKKDLYGADFALLSLHGGHAYGYHGVGSLNEAGHFVGAEYLVDIDLFHPDIPWTCEIAAPPGGGGGHSP